MRVRRRGDINKKRGIADAAVTSIVARCRLTSVGNDNPIVLYILLIGFQN